MKQMKNFFKIVLTLSFVILLSNCQKQDTLPGDTTAKAVIASPSLKAGTLPGYMQNLTATVNDMLEKGLITKGEAQSLLAKISSATASLSRGNTSSFNGQMGSITNEVGLMVETGVLSPEQGQLLQDQTTYAVNVVNHIPLISEGLLAWYPFNGNAQDVSGNNKNGVEDKVTYSADFNGAPNSAATFNGDGFISVPAIGQAHGDFSISLWYKTIVGGTILSTNTIFFGADPSYPQFLVSWVIMIGTNDGVYGPSGNPLYLDNSWHHVVITHNSTEGVIKTYFDGTLRHNRPNSGYFVGNSQNIFFGKVFANAYMQFNYVSSYYTGSVDEIYLFNRAITQAEVDQLYYHPN